MNRWFGFLLAFGLIAHLSSAQAGRTITARIVEKGTQNPIPETNIRLEDGSAGTTTNDKGQFSLTLTDAQAGANVVVSHVGYQTVTIPAAQIGTEIQLDEQVYQIGEVTIRHTSLLKLLLKTWKVADESIEQYAALALEYQRLNDPKKYEQSVKNPDALRRGTKLIRIVFHKDGSARIKALLVLGQNFEWRLDEDTRKLVLIDKDGKERQRTVEELSANRLSLTRLDAQGKPITISYVPN